ncbi:MAG TPA: PP2C family serine/threonine-protein phosphatase [Chthoniobacterales bacterium]
MKWTIAGASVAGTSHLRAATPCQDSHGYRTVRQGQGNVLLIAVSDGAGSASHSDTGSRTAVEATLAFLERWAGSGEEFTRCTALAAGEAARQAIFREAQRLRVSRREVACTLLFACVAEQSAIFAQIGDGAWVMGMGGSPWAATWPRAGRYANETDFLTADGWTGALQVKRETGPVDCVGVLTDGLQNVALHHASRTAHQPFFRPLLSVLHGNPLAGNLDEQLAAFLANPDLNRRTDDDKTLVMAVKRRLYLPWRVS